MRALIWIARYVEHARDKLAIDPKDARCSSDLTATPLNPDTLTEYGRRYIQSAGIEQARRLPHLSSHDGHADARKGADIRNIQVILGHEKLDTTQIYTRVGLSKLLDTQSKTHPAERPDPDSPSSESTGPHSAEESTES